MTLFVVATPIGNMGDLTLRALDTLKRVPIIAAEDTRRTRNLLTHFGIAGKELTSLHAHSSERDVARLIARMIGGEDVALVTDAGTPSVSDPGDALVRAAIEREIAVVPIPGASAVTAALAASGLASGAGFRFFGFLPRAGPERAEAIATISETREPCVLFESPERARATLSDLARATPERRACVARELTKVHEELARGSLRELAARTEWLGEITIVLGAHQREAPALGDAAIDARIEEELRTGAHAKTVAQRVAAWSGLGAREIYQRVIAKKRP